MRFEVVVTLLVAVLAVMASFGAARPFDIACKSNPCTGAVLVTFYGSDACYVPYSWKIEAASYFRDGLLPGVCQVSPGSLKMHSDELGQQHDISLHEAHQGSGFKLPDRSKMYYAHSNPPGILWNQWNVGDCSGMPAQMTFLHTGLCYNSTTRAGRKSQVLLASINDTLPSPPILETPAPFPKVKQHSVIYCKPGQPCGLAWNTVYADPNCQKPVGESESIPLQNDSGAYIALDECYTMYSIFKDSDALGSNVNWSCRDGLFTETLYQGYGCNSTINRSSSFPLGICLPDDFGKYVMRFCAQK